MAYRPTNDVKDNIIHRNTVFDSQGMVSCCTCGHCINKTEDATLTLTNFKKADPLFNEQSIGSTIIEFSDYMIPTGSFDYVLTPYQTTDAFADGTDVTNLKFADSLVYYPFLKCNGITTADPQSSYWPTSINVNGLPTQTIKSYESSFAGFSFFGNGVALNPIITQSVFNLKKYPNIVDSYLYTDKYITGDDQIKYNSQFGSYVYNVSVKGRLFGFDYNNTDLKDCFYNASFCSNCTNNKNDYYPWGYYLKKTTFDNSPPARFNSYDFSSIYNFNVKSVIQNGINPNLSKAINSSVYYGYTNNLNFYAAIDSYLLSLSNVIDDSYYWFNDLNQKMDYTNWISPGDSNPCNEIQLGNIATNNGYNITNYLTPKPYPDEINIGDYQTYLNYINEHDFTHLGFKSDANCSNNIVKLITPVYFKSFDNYSFSYTYPNYTKTNSVFGITDKFIIPDFQTWQDCLYNSSGISAKTVELKEMNSADNIYKSGYVLDKFQINKNGAFSATISIINNSYFYSFGLKTPWNLKKLLTYDFSQNCTYFLNSWENKISNSVNMVESIYETPLIQENEFVRASPTTYIDYFNQVKTGFYTNGSFNDYSSGLPVTYYEDICLGYIEQPKSLALPISYVAQKTHRTKIESITDSTGRTTTTIKNVLWVGKTLLTETYTHNDGVNRPKTAVGQIPLNYDAILKGGFESDIVVSFQSKPMCSIFSIVDELKRVTQFKVNFENYKKPPQQNFLVNDYTQEIVNATPNIPSSFINDNFLTTYYKSFDNIAFGIPNTNPNEYFYIQKQIQKPTSPYYYSSHEDWELVKKIKETSPELVSYTAFAGRVYPDFGVPDKFKSCLLINGSQDVWKTGNEVKFGTDTTIYYSIYIEEIKDKKQNAGQSLIRIATTLQNANNGIYIPNVGLETQFKNKSLTVKFLSSYKDFSKLDAPRYDDFNPNLLSTTNKNADDRGISYSVTGSFSTPFTQQINIRMNPAIQTPSGIHYFLPSTYPLINFGLLMNYQAYGNTSTKPNYVDPTSPLSTYLDNQFVFYDRIEVISLSPLKVKYINMKFVYNDAINVKQYNLQYTPPGLSLINANGQCFWGFQCDIVMEEVVDEFIQEALPVEFNQILENVEYIQTSNLMNARKPLQMINPEKCEHIGKVIDRKDCNCPKKWIRECELHGKTDWKKCMTCKDFKLSE